MIPLAYKVKGARFDFRGELFRYHPLPQDDELLSSWLVRIALAHRTDPATFVNLYLPQYRNVFWDKDMDVSATWELMEMLSFKSGFDHDLFFRLTLKSYEGYLAERISGKTRNPFIQSLGRCSRVKVKNGLRFCPLCLKEDRESYFRKKWRLSFSTACLRHRCFLLDRCLECGAAVNPYRSMRLLDLDMTHCYKCGADLKEAEPEYVQEGSYGLWAIKRLYEILDSGVFSYHGGYAYSFLFFDVLRHFIKMVYFWGKGKGLLDHEVMGWVTDFRTGETGNSLTENILLKEQYLLFSGLMRLFEGFPGRVLSFCGAGGLRGTDLTRDMRVVPFWYQGIVDEFDKGFYKVDIQEVWSVVAYLKRKGMAANKANVGRMLGVDTGFKKREDILKLLRGDSRNPSSNVRFPIKCMAKRY